MGALRRGACLPHTPYTSEVRRGNVNSLRPCDVRSMFGRMTTLLLASLLAARAALPPAPTDSTDLRRRVEARIAAVPGATVAVEYESLDGRRKAVYRHSVIPGGAYSGKALSRAIANDRVVAAHYAGATGLSVDELHSAVEAQEARVREVLATDLVVATDPEQSPTFDMRTFSIRRP